MKIPKSKLIEKVSKEDREVLKRVTVKDIHFENESDALVLKTTGRISL